LPHQLKRVARRAALGVGRMGGVASNSSGDIFIAFSTANPHASRDSGLAQVSMVANDRITPLFEATVQATEEAIVNAMLAAQTMTGADDLTVFASRTIACARCSSDTTGSPGERRVSPHNGSFPPLKAADLRVRPLARAETIPSAWYTDPRFHALDRDAIFATSWQHVAGQPSARPAR